MGPKSKSNKFSNEDDLQWKITSIYKKWNIFLMIKSCKPVKKTPSASIVSSSLAVDDGSFVYLLAY
jgi:hypothetical protein